MKRIDVLKNCPEEFEEELISFIDSIELVVNEVINDLDPTEKRDLDDHMAGIQSAFDDLQQLSRDLY